jgi:hypothetical protein
MMAAIAADTVAASCSRNEPVGMPIVPIRFAQAGALQRTHPYGKTAEAAR